LPPPPFDLTPAPPLPSPKATAKQDPHITFAHGGRADFRGKDGVAYNMLSAPRISFALLTQNASFILPGYSPKYVHGSFFTNSFWTLRSRDSGVQFLVNCSANVIGFDVRFVNESIAAIRRGMWKDFVFEDVRVYYKYNTLFVRAAGWETNVTRHAVYNWIAGPKWRFDVAIRPLNNTGFEYLHGMPSDVVAPHGLIGQSWDSDDIAVDGAMDDYKVTQTEIWTKAMAEGSIEGDASEYALATPFSTQFKYSRFDTSVPTPHRDVSKLSGTKRKNGVLFGGGYGRRSNSGTQTYASGVASSTEYTNSVHDDGASNEFVVSNMRRRK